MNVGFEPEFKTYLKVKGWVRGHLNLIRKIGIRSTATHWFTDPVRRFMAVNRIHEVEVHVSANRYARFWYHNCAHRDIDKSPAGS